MEPSSILEEIAEFSRYVTQMGQIVTSLSDCMDQIFEKLEVADMEHWASVKLEKTHINRRDAMVKPPSGHYMKEKQCDELLATWVLRTCEKINPDLSGKETPWYKFRAKNSLGKATVTESCKTKARTIAARKRTVTREGQRKHRRRKKRWRPK